MTRTFEIEISAEFGTTLWEVEVSYSMDAPVRMVTTHSGACPQAPEPAQVRSIDSVYMRPKGEGAWFPVPVEWQAILGITDDNCDLMDLLEEVTG